ncbi:non-ribosomal peptide synthetase [Deinococcus ruber]|uniref:Carrier domain-containing protein n=1 Tax=Deinococcus ruber TaxID=1848197 RepID=A0A918FC63_9DEIO|nr:non-ribosomal peptide synthetase [Deinococcus ruber]GGR20807.1 hypothetical protein GCM10008957_36490 [Deinococcus ruber]
MHRMRIIGISHLDDLPAEHASSVPASALETEIALIWQEVLGRSGVRPSDHFFELGGDSLGVVRVAARIQERYRVRIPLAELFTTPTLTGMAARVKTALGHPDSLDLKAVQKRPHSLLSPPSLSQERMWLLHQLDSGGTAYSVVGTARLRGTLSVKNAEASLRAIVERHEALRTTFEQEDGQLRQRVLAPEFHLERIDLTTVPSVRQDEEARRQIRSLIARPFDFRFGPVFRATLFHLDKEHHLLLLDLPHLNSDAWSLSVLLEEFITGYEAGLNGQQPVLPPLPVQYRDYAAWQREWLQGDGLEELRAYWRSQLRQLAPLALPIDLPRPALMGFTGASVSYVLPAPLIARLRNLARQHDATLFMLLLTVFKVLLMRWSGTDDIAVGTPVAGRQTPGIERLIGVFVNTLVMRTDLSGQPSFRTALARVRKVAIEAFAHQDMPFAQLVADLQPSRDLSRSPLVQVMFNHINVPMPRQQIKNLELSYLEFDREGAQFDLSCTVTELPGEERLTLEYSTALFKRSSIEQLLSRFVRLLEAVVVDPDQEIGELPFVSPNELQLLQCWRGERTPAPNETIHGLFEAQVRLIPQHTALRFKNQTLRYGELNTAANQLARQLRQLGVGSETVVAVYLSRSPRAIIALLAVLKAGGAYLPLDPAQPAARLREVLAHAAPLVVLSTHDLRPQLTDSPVPVIYLDHAAHSTESEAGENLDLLCSPEQLANVLYTSGSTGQPKGVLGVHRGVVHRLRWMWETYPFSQGEVCCQKTSLGFVDSVWEVFGPLLAGIPLIIVPDEVVRDPPALLELLGREEVTRIVLVPSLLRALLNTGPTQHQLPRLMLWSSSGETLTADLASQFYRNFPQARLLNLYGSTEVTADATWTEVRPQNEDGFVPVGQPLRGTQVYVVDAHLRVLPPGLAGELLIGGHGLARGYHRQPHLTAERFLDSPGDAGRVYRSGDRAVFLPDGMLRILGRLDRQVKIRGVRIELEDVESVLLGHPQIRSCAVTLSQDEEAELIAYMTAQPPLGAAELRRYLAERVTAPLIPARMVFLDELPLTASGKLDRERLSTSLPEAPRSAAPARTPLELQVAALWGALLEVPPESIGLHDNFFNLGGHSLLAARLMAQIESAFGVRIPLTALFQEPTVAALTRHLEPEAVPLPPQVIPLQPGGSELPLFCIPGIGGQIASIRELAAAMAPEQPVYGLDAPGTNKQITPVQSVVALADSYLPALRQVQPHGPYFLCGHSFGGLIAYELARQLQQAGETVGLVMLLDTYTPRPQQVSPFLWLQALYRAGSDELRAAWQQPREYTRKNLRRLRTAGRSVVRRWKRHQSMTTPGDVPAWSAASVQASLQAAARYHAAPLQAPVVLLKARDRWLIEPLFTWEDVTRRPVDVKTVGGNHANMVGSEHAEALAVVLKQELSRARQRLDSLSDHFSN